MNKKETLKEAMERLYPYIEGEETLNAQNSEGRNDFEAGVNWQTERMYSEEDMIEFAKYCNLKDDLSVRELLKIWFEQFKKK